MKKLVNDVEVDMTQAEIDEFNQREADWEASKNERMQLLYSETLQSHIDSKAAEKQYNNGFACASYANSTNQNWKNEALAFIAWRDSCWSYLIDTQTQIENEEIEPPSIQDFIANIPSFNWE